MRPYKTSDVEALYQLQRSSLKDLNEWYLGIMAKRETTTEDIKGYIQTIADGWKDKSWMEYAAFNKQSNQLIGAASFHHMDWDVPKGRIGYFVDANCTGNGYATELANIMTRLAFERMNLARFELRAATENPASNIIAKKLGYSLSGTLEKNKISVNGKLWDINIYARSDSKNLPELKIDYT